jgi:hypothetical protein
VADGLKPEFAFPSHIGYSLGAVAFANMGIHKSGEGANAPIEWQRGNVGAVIDYCLNDVKITKRLFDRVRQIGGLRSPKAPTRFLDMRKPA